MITGQGSEMTTDNRTKKPDAEAVRTSVDQLLKDSGAGAIDDR
jgi:hypothetical protein